MRRELQWHTLMWRDDVCEHMGLAWCSCAMRPDHPARCATDPEHERCRTYPT